MGVCYHKAYAEPTSKKLVARFNLSSVKPGSPPASAGTVASAVQDAAKAVCGLYKEFPRFYTGLANPEGSTLQKFQKKMMDGLCNNHAGGLPPPPQSQFEGGQCAIDYCYDWSSSKEPRDPGAAPGQSGCPFVTQGPLSNSRIIEVSPPFYDPLVDADVRQYSMSFLNANGDEVFGGQFAFADGDGVELVANPQGAEPDNCGDPDPEWQDKVPPPDRVNIEITSPAPDGTSETTQVNIAPVWINGAVHIDFGGIDISFGPNTVNVGGTPGVTGDADIGDQITNTEIQNNFTDINNSVSNVSNQVNSVSNSVENTITNTENIQIQNTEILTTINEIQFVPPPPESPDVDEEERTEEDPPEEDGLIDLYYVKITLTALPNRRKIQFGEGAPDVVHAGWFEWLFDGCPGERRPINFNNQIFQNVKGATGYAYTLTYGSAGYATIYKKAVPA